MLSNDGYFIIQHDTPLLAVAAGLCFLASLAAVSLFDHARRTDGGSRLTWLSLAALAGGVGVWATHFFAMMAFITGLQSGYDRGLALVALIVAVLVEGAGFALAGLGRGRVAALAGGALIGGGIAAMHACGMAAYAVAGEVTWDHATVALAVALGVALSMAGIEIARGGRLADRVAGAALLAEAVCAHHFTALGAVSIGMDPGAQVPVDALPPGLLVLPVALASGLILFLATVALGIDLRARRRTEAEIQRMTSLADAAVEGLMICDGDRIVTANSSLGLLSGFAPAEIAGMALSRLLADTAALDALLVSPGDTVETTLATMGGETVPVEVLRKEIEFAGKRHQAIALRDLRARNHAEERIRFLAHHDSLTGLQNRAFFELRLDEMIAGAHRLGRGFAVLCLDLDRFKEVNDIFGHPAGDEALRSVGRVLSNLVRGTQIAARLGGDEFAVVLPDVRDAAQAAWFAADILRALALLDAERGSGPPSGGSIGIALFPRDGDDRQALLGAADTALYRAKAEGRGICRCYEGGMGVEVRDRRRIEHDLRDVAARDEMSLVYQPQMATGTGAAVGFEVLLRWHHPERGFVSPAQFIPIAEESGAILQIGEWVLRTACTEAAGWRVPLRLAVNVSAVQLHAPGFADLVETILAETGIDPRRLELEITETALIRDITRALAALTRLKALGVKIAMDDFGTGYSSLSNLRAFPFDRIKIDGSFTRSVDSNQQAAAIVRAILELGRGLGLSILAEGVETAAELGFLRAEACHEVQGYYFGRPAPIAQFDALTRGDQSEGRERRHDAPCPHAAVA